MAANVRDEFLLSPGCDLHLAGVRTLSLPSCPDAQPPAPAGRPVRRDSEIRTQAAWGECVFLTLTPPTGSHQRTMLCGTEPWIAVRSDHSGCKVNNNR